MKLIESSIAISNGKHSKIPPKISVLSGIVSVGNTDTEFVYADTFLY